MEEWIEDRVQTGRTFLFRGQPEHCSLRPRLLRMLLDSNSRDYARVNELEMELRRDFVRQAPLHLNEGPIRALEEGVADVLWCWATMQHYGAPTRLLDWTGSPYVALYFAVADQSKPNGELWCYAQDTLEQLHRTALEEKKLDVWPVKLSSAAYSERRAIDGTPILHHFILGTWTTRMAAQQGVFTVCTDIFQEHSELLEQLLQDGGVYQRAVIPQECKLTFLKRLHLMNITGASLFPGIDGVGRFVDEKARLGLVRQHENEGAP